jgi:hypothetical protein
MSLQLLALRGPEVGRAFPVPPGRVVTLGRYPDSDVHLPQSTVSRRHAALELAPEEGWLWDLGSRNGTWLNGQALAAAGPRAALRRGDRLRVCDWVLLLQEEGEPWEAWGAESRACDILREVLPRASPRKLALFCHACWGRLWPLPDPLPAGFTFRNGWPEWWAVLSRDWARSGEGDVPFNVTQAAQDAVRATRGQAPPDWRADLLREVFGNPYRPVPIDPLWLCQGEGCVTRLARVLYDEERFEDLPILGDALEEAGCTDRALLDHCRRAGGHVRGCWALDAVLGRG